VSSLSDCLSKLGKVFSPDERAAIFEARKAHLATGLDAPAAELATVNALYADAQAEHKSVVEAIASATEMKNLPVFDSKQEAMLAAQEQTKASRARYEVEQHPGETGKWTISQTARTEAQETAARKTSRRQIAARKPDESRDTITTFIAKMGGLRLDEAPDITGEHDPLRAPNAPMLFLIRRQGGLSLDAMGEYLVEAGYFNERPDEEQIRDAIAAELGGKNQYSIWGTEAQVSEREQKEFDQEAAAVAFAEEAGIELEQSSTAEDIATIRDFVPAIESELTGPRLAIAELSLKAAAFDEAALERLAIESEDFSDAQYAVALQEIIYANEQDVAGRDSGGGEAVEPLTLTGETEGERAAREAGSRARSDREQREADERDARARADAELGEFGLTGSERAADANVNQGSVFSMSDELTPAATAQWPAIVSRIAELAQKITPAVRINLAEGALSFDEAGSYEIAGLYNPIKNLIEVSLYSSDPVRTFRHEGLHALKGMGLFTPQEWRALEAQARKTWRSTYEVERRWAGLNLNDAQFTEEAIAEAFSDYRTGTLNTQPPIHRIMRKIAEFFDRLGNLLRGMGFQTVDDIFAKAEAGEVGRREGIASTEGGEKFAVPPVPPAKRTAFIASASRRLRNQHPQPAAWVGDLGSFVDHAIKPRTIAAFNRDAVPAYSTLIEEQKFRDAKFAEYTRKAEPYFLGTKEDRSVVDKILEHDRLTGAFGLAGQNMTVHFTSNEAVLSKPGERVTATAGQKTMYWAARDMLNLTYEDFKARLLEDFNLPAGMTVASIQQLVAMPQTLTLTPVQKGQHTRRLKELAAAAEALKAVEEAYRRGYVPFSRFGNVGIAVKDAKGATVEYVTLDLGPIDRLRAKRGFDRIPEVRIALDRLRQRHRGTANTVGQPFKIPTGKLAKEVSLADVDELAEIGKIEDSQWDDIRKQLATGQAAQGFKAHMFRSKAIPGYSTDFERVLANYINQAATFQARRKFAKQWNEAINNIDAGRQPELRRYFKDLSNSVHDPKEEFSALRAMTFAYYLTSIASWAVNVSQIVTVTAPVAMQFANPVSVGLAIGRAWPETWRMLSWDKTTQNQFYDPQKAPADVRVAVVKAFDEGEFVNVVTRDYMGLAQNSHPVLKKLTPGAQRLVEILGAGFTVAEMQNRISTYISMLRLARDNPRVKVDFARVMAKNAIAEQLIANWSPQGFADFMNDETNFKMGKINRARLERGVGTVVTQFWGYTWNYMERLVTMIALQGAEGRGAAVLMLTIMWFFAGIWGLPGLDRLKQLIEALSRKVFKSDLDLDLEMRKLVVEVTGIMELAYMMSGGASRAVGGPDLSSRIGMGQLFNTPVFLDLVGRVPDAMEQFEVGNAILGIAELLPKQAGDILIAKTWGEQGVRTQAQDAPVIPRGRVTTGMQIQKALGFNPAEVAERRALERAEKRIEKSADEARHDFYRRMSKAEYANREAVKVGDTADAKLWRSEVDKIWSEVKAWNDTHKQSEHIKLNKVTREENLKREYQGAARQKGKRKAARGEIRDIQDLYGTEAR